jgi:carboxyl-terminal processing protease
MDTVKAQPHKHYSMVDSTIKANLQALSAERIAKNEDFGKLLGRIDAYRKQKSEKLIPLKEEEYMARRKETSMEKEEEKQLDNKAERDKVFVNDFYNEEVLNVAIDYVKSLAASGSLVTK